MDLEKQEMVLKMADLIKQKNVIEEQLNDYKAINNFLMKRENKLRQIETMFRNGVVDLSELSRVVRGEKGNGK